MVTLPSTPTAPSLDDLRRRTSEKWSTYPDDVLPLFVAEMDFTIADVVADAITTDAASMPGIAVTWAETVIKDTESL